MGLPWGQVVGSPSRRTRRGLDRIGDDVLPLAGLGVGVGPRQAQDVGEEALGQAVAAHHALGQAQPVVGEADGPVDGDQALLLHAVDHLRHGRAGHVEPLGDAGLDDVDVVLAQLEDGLAVLLERRVVLGRLVGGHAGSVRGDLDAATAVGTVGAHGPPTPPATRRPHGARRRRAARDGPHPRRLRQLEGRHVRLRRAAPAAAPRRVARSRWWPRIDRRAGDTLRCITLDAARQADLHLIKNEGPRHRPQPAT